MYTCELSARNFSHHLAGQPEGVVSNASSVDRHQDAIDVSHIEVVTNQEHGARGQLKNVLAGAIAKDRLQASQAAGAHHDQIRIQLISHRENGLFGVSLADDRVHVTRVEAKLFNSLGQQAAGRGPVLV